jgi:uncharacterized damage-inducible protein DinB
MKIDREFVCLQLDYSRWASERSLDAARVLTADELARDLGNSYGGVAGTLEHIFQADRVWLSRVEGSPRLTLCDPGETWTLESLAAEWADVASRWRAWAETTDDFEANLQYKNLAGQDHGLPLWQLVLHLVNHATYHRGQITTMLRQLGHKPVATDLHVFYLSRR